MTGLTSERTSATMLMRSSRQLFGRVLLGILATGSMVPWTSRPLFADDAPAVSQDLPDAPAEFVPVDPDVALDGAAAPGSVPPPVTDSAVEQPPMVPPPALEGTAAPKKPAAPKPPPAPFKPMFFNNDFSYKKDPSHKYILGEELKDMPIGEYTGWDWMDESKVSFGGEIRYRYMDERNRLRPGGPGHSNYDLWRWRNYVDYKFSPQFRAYVEMIDASIFKNELPVTGIDKNRWDLQNYFFDYNFVEYDNRQYFVRVGRQELFYGNQRLISPLDWANTRRNFEGIKVFTPGENWDLDAWVVNPVNTATPNDGPVDRFDNEFDSRNQDRVFAGSYWTYKAVKNNTFDVFFLYDRFDANPAGFPVGERYTPGVRWLGNMPMMGCDGKPERTFHMEVEGAYQGGHDRGRDVQSGFVVVGAGHTWNSTPWEPSLWMFYDWAGGDSNPTDGHYGTFFQGYGLVHAYLGLIDNIARQNLQDVNWRFTVKPTQKLQLQTQMHLYYLANENDVLYNVTGAPVGTPGISGGSNEVGQELDLLATWTFNPNLSVEAGYFWFWNGTYLQRAAPRDHAQMFYLQTTLKY